MTSTTSLLRRESGMFFVIAIVLLAAPAVTSVFMHGYLVLGVLLALFMLVIAWSLSSLQVRVREGRLRVQLGGVITVRNVALADIASVERVRVPSGAGLGVRSLAEGTLYTVTWGDAVQIQLRDGSRFFVGSDAPDTMCAALQTSLRSSNAHD